MSGECFHETATVATISVIVRMEWEDGKRKNGEGNGSREGKNKMQERERERERERAGARKKWESSPTGLRPQIQRRTAQWFQWNARDGDNRRCHLSRGPISLRF